MLIDHFFRQVHEEATLCVVPRREVKADMPHGEVRANVRENTKGWEPWLSRV
jgi:hypothetical protein